MHKTLPKHIESQLKENFITVEEFATMSGKNARVIRQHITDGLLKAVKVARGTKGFKYMVEKVDAADFLTNQGEPLPLVLSSYMNHFAGDEEPAREATFFTLEGPLPQAVVVKEESFMTKVKAAFSLICPFIK